MLISRILHSNSIRPSSLMVRLPKIGLCDDSRNINKSLRNIKKQLRAKDDPKEWKGKDRTRGTTMDGTLDDLVGLDSDLQKRTSLLNPSSERVKTDLRNRYHRDLWQSMKKNDRIKYDKTVQQLKNSGLEMDCISYTLMIHGLLIFNKNNDIQEAMNIIEQMKDAGIHPSLIRLMARLIATYNELTLLKSRPIYSNWINVIRSSWLIAYFINKRTNKYKLLNSYTCYYAEQSLCPGAFAKAL